MNLDALLEEFLTSIKTKVNSSMYKTYFKDLKFVKYENNELTVLVNNINIKKQLETKLKNTIYNIIDILIDKKCNIKYILDSELDLNNAQEKKFKTPEQISYLDLFEPPKQEESPPTEKVKYVHQSNLDKKYTLENFIKGNSNMMAYSYAELVLQNLGTTYNPFFIRGNSGLGKTHLMQALGNEVEKNTNLKVLYARSNEFIDDYIEMTRQKNNINLKSYFKNKYRNIDVLIVDDIQFISGKKQCQVEFFDIFQELYNNHKQIIIASDRKPDDIQDLDERLKSRFVWGAEIEICPPEKDLRKKILLNFIKKENMPIVMSDETVDFIVENIKDDVRKIEGSVRTLMTYLQAFKINNGFCNDNSSDGIELTINEVKQALSDKLSKGTTQDTSIIKIQHIVADYYNVNIDDLKSKKRTNKIAKPRQVAMYLCRAVLNSTFEDIGREFGGKDHTTVMHAVHTIEESIQTNPAVLELIEDLKIKIVS